MPSTLNGDAHPYAKYKFKGNEECAKTYARIEAQSKKVTKPLMNKEEWDMFCRKRILIV